MCNISYGCHGIQDKHKWCSSMSHFIPNSTTYTCHCYFLPLAMTGISDVSCDKHKLNLIHLSQTNPTMYQKKQNFSKNSVICLTQFCKNFLNTSYERQLWVLWEESNVPWRFHLLRRPLWLKTKMCLGIFSTIARTCKTLFR